MGERNAKPPLWQVNYGDRWHGGYYAPTADAALAKARQMNPHHDAALFTVTKPPPRD